MKKGISLIILVVIIIVLIILTGVIVINSEYMIVDTSISRLKTDITQLEYLMSTYIIRKSGNIDFEIVNFDTSGLTEEEAKQFSGEKAKNNKIQLYVIDLQEIDAEEVNYGKLENGVDDRYVYSFVDDCADCSRNNGELQLFDDELYSCRKSRNEGK